MKANSISYVIFIHQKRCFLNDKKVDLAAYWIAPLIILAAIPLDRHPRSPELLPHPQKLSSVKLVPADGRSQHTLIAMSTRCHWAWKTLQKTWIFFHSCQFPPENVPVSVFSTAAVVLRCKVIAIT